MLMSGMGSNEAGMRKMMRGMLSGMTSMMKQLSEGSEASESCCGGMFTEDGQLASLAKQCRPLLEQMKEFFPQ